jgi:hypothetical protein
MPCTQTGSIEGDRRLAAEETVQEINEENTRLTQMLCQACRIIEDEFGEEYSDKMPEVLKEWWEQHKKIDAQKNQ